jgi:integrating conjugative element protein (TIGR03752 family)
VKSELGPQLKVPRSLDELAQRTQQKLLPDLPVYTINRDATLIGSVSMTALIGRIPIGGQVTDPYPFKILIGANNLAANGIEIPGLETMIMSGTATGDWALACVRGEISSATFVFRDGTIRSFPKPERNDKGSVSGTRRKSFGYLSDKFGIPCISGERKTNAVEYLTTRVGLAAAQAAAEAAAAAQTSTVMSSQTGAVASAVTGSPSLYAKNKAIASGIQESSTWVRERQAQSFDAIFVRGGAEVAVHIDEEIPIDYEFSGRRVNHHPAVPWNDGAAMRATLD